MEIQAISPRNISAYQKLFSVCFSRSNMSPEYINWLYYKNPLGKAVGFDAVEEGKVVSHYACIPTSIDGVSGLLSVNTATHPNFRSQGLYKKLAAKTYEQWSRDFHFVVGVANAQSAETFVKRLGFTEVGRLNLRYGKLDRPQIGSRSWTSDELEWRINCPRQKLQKKIVSSKSIQLSIRPKNSPIKLKSIVPLSVGDSNENREAKAVGRLGFTVDWVRDSKPITRLPEKLKPSPLVLIFQSLSGAKVEVNSWSFSDFDVF
jgi:GNAT superfamily N-acetyltransferase